MTAEEAISVIYTERKCVDRNDGVHCNRKCEECGLLLPIGKIRDAYNMAIDALEKQIPKKPNGKQFPQCPICGSDSIDEQLDGGYQITKHNYCPDCGQVIDWEDWI